MKPCPICGDTGPWSHGGGRAAHIRSHHETVCEDCGQTVNTVGYASHRRILHPEAGDAAGADLAAGRGNPSKEEGVSAPPTRPPAPAAEPAPPPVPAASRYVRCPDCGKSCREAGLAIHRSKMHPPAAPRRAAATSQRRPSRRRLAHALDELVPGAAPELLARLVAFVEKHQPDENTGLLIVATPGGAGPWLTRPAAVGLVITREHAPAVVVALDDVYAHARHKAREPAAASA